MNLPKDDQLLRGRVRILWSLINLGLFPFYLLLSNSSTSSTIFTYRIEINSPSASCGDPNLLLSPLFSY